MGAQIRALGPVDEKERTRLARLAVAELTAAGRRPYLIGEPVVGALGYVQAAQELHEQAMSRGIDLRHIVLPGSMGVTEAGLIFGAALLRLPWTFHLVSVEYDAHTLEERIRGILDGLSLITKTPLADDALRHVRIHMDQLGSGYGIPTAESIEASAIFAKLEALVIEQTYVAKTFAGLVASVVRREIPPQEAVCVLHTGGTPAVF
jgi:1-aminocyclopropane-1-carboxylate deaminase/D-cysteine desulfhydrase-like pyridoxal-dependent ACC family enzyme